MDPDGSVPSTTMPVETREVDVLTTSTVGLLPHREGTLMAQRVHRRIGAPARVGQAEPHGPGAQRTALPRGDATQRGGEHERIPADADQNPGTDQSLDGPSRAPPEQLSHAPAPPCASSRATTS
ncbi:hypothetical protein BJF82_15990 [Kytococcus sp. CUA-901]|nr:hypothetical protein BJF82_15990 [Kytococcus sp. CUA-901]